MVLFVVSVIVFCVMSFTGDPVLMIVPPTASEAQIQEARVALGLDKPLVVQYEVFLKNLLHGSLGVSYMFKRPALDLILERMPATLELVFLSVLISVLVAIPCGVFAGAWPNNPLSRLIMNERFKAEGAQNVYLPMVIPSSLFNKEKEHIEGFAPECLVDDWRWRETQ